MKNFQQASHIPEEETPLTHNSLPKTDINQQQILHQRARALACTIDEESQATDVLDIISFEFGAQHFGLESRFVVQVGHFGEIVPLPCTPDFLVGLVNVRGRIVPVYNLLRILGFAEPGLADSHQVLHVSADDVDICILADKVNATERLPLSELQTHLQIASQHTTEFVRGITAKQLVIIDVAAILAGSAITVDSTEHEQTS